MEAPIQAGVQIQERALPDPEFRLSKDAHTGFTHGSAKLLQHDRLVRDLPFQHAVRNDFDIGPRH